MQSSVRVGRSVPTFAVKTKSSNAEKECNRRQRAVIQRKSAAAANDIVSSL